MITNTKAISNNKDFMELEINYAINLKIYKKIETDTLKIDFDFDKKLITQNEAQEIVDYFIKTESSMFFKS